MSPLKISRSNLHSVEWHWHSTEWISKRRSCNLPLMAHTYRLFWRQFSEPISLTGTKQPAF